MKKLIGVLAVVLVCLYVSTEAMAVVSPPYAAPSGFVWALGPELITNGGFEADTVGSIPATWTYVNGTAPATTDASAYAGSQSMLLGNNTIAKTTYSIPTSVGKSYLYTVEWKQSLAAWGPNFRIGLFQDPGFAPSGPGADQLSVTEDWPAAVFEYANSRQPMWRDYTYVTSWQTYSATYQVAPSVSDFGNKLTPYFWGSAVAGTTWQVDSLSLREWTLVPTPEPGTIALLGLGLTGLVLRRRS